MKKGIKSRKSIYIILKALKNNTSKYDEILKKEINKNKFDSKDINFIQAIVLDSLRYSNQIKKIIHQFVRKKINNDSFILLLSAIAQLIYLDFKAYAVVNSTVELAKNNQIKASPGFINAVLKKIILKKDSLTKIKVEINDLPDWFINQISNLKKNEVNKIITAISEKPQLHLVFKNNLCLKKFINERNEKDFITSEKSLMLKKTSNIYELPRYNDGEWWVQDYSAMLPLHLYKNLNNKKTIDMCSAPGGKTFQALSLKANLDIIEKNPIRAKILKENLLRLKFFNKIETKDSLKIYNKARYDTILIDAPCSSVGTLRKNPEIFFRDKKINVFKYLDIQKKLLNKASNLVNVNGEIIYMVCSFLEIETTNQIQKFLKENKNFSIKKFTNIKYKNIIDDEGFINIIPMKIENILKIDGFFAAILTRDV